MKHGFDAPVLVCIDESGASVSLASERTYTGSRGDSWVIPEGFRTDFATIPSILSWAVMKMGLWTLAAIVHDLLCEGLNRWHAALAAVRKGYAVHGSDGVTLGIWLDGKFIPEPTADAVDTDAIFYKIARDYGTDIVTANLLWVGVRWGALANPARRKGFMRRDTFWWFVLLSLAFVWVVPIALLALVGQGMLALARLAFR